MATTYAPDDMTLSEFTTAEDELWNSTRAVSTPTMTTSNEVLGKTEAYEILPYPECIATLEYQYGLWISRYHHFVALPIAILGSLMVLIVYGSRMFKGTPYLYMCVLAIADVLTILFDWVYRKASNLIYYNWSDLGCGAMVYFCYSTVEFAILVLVVMTVERALVIGFPLKFQRFFSVKKALIAIFIAFAVPFGFNAPALVYQFSYRRTPVGEYHCNWIYDHYDHATIIVSAKQVAFLFVPVVILFVCNIWIIIVMRRSASEKSQMTSDSSDRAQSQLRHITAQMLSVSIAFVLMEFINVVFTFPNSTFQFAHRWPRCSMRWLRRLCAGETGRFLAMMQHAVNAYMYCLVSARFRAELLEKLGIRKKDKSPVTGTTNLSNSVSKASA